jgi:hypothetical protein
MNAHCQLSVEEEANMPTMRMSDTQSNFSSELGDVAPIDQGPSPRPPACLVTNGRPKLRSVSAGAITCAH